MILATILPAVHRLVRISRRIDRGRGGKERQLVQHHLRRSEDPAGAVRAHLSRLLKVGHGPLKITDRGTSRDWILGDDRLLDRRDLRGEPMLPAWRGVLSIGIFVTGAGEHRRGRDHSGKGNPANVHGWNRLPGRSSASSRRPRCGATLRGSVESITCLPYPVSAAELVDRWTMYGAMAHHRRERSATASPRS
jgi:hypothetical protein